MVWVTPWYWNFEHLTSSNGLLQLHHPYPAYLHAFQVLIYFFLPPALEVVICEVTFFTSVWLHDNFILHQNRIFRISDATMQARLNTDCGNCLGKNNKDWTNRMLKEKMPQFNSCCWYIMWYTWTFFASVWLHDNFILHQNRIFRIVMQQCRLDWTLILGIVLGK